MKIVKVVIASVLGLSISSAFAVEGGQIHEQMKLQNKEQMKETIGTNKAEKYHQSMEKKREQMKNQHRHQHRNQIMEARGEVIQGRRMNHSH